jgi:hypothetical protein
MRKLVLAFCCGALVLVMTPAGSSARQGGEPVLSPPEKAMCAFPDGKTVKIDYSSPRMRGRKIFGDLVPYNDVWRAGANEATSFAINTPVTISGKVVPPGSYTLFTLPTATKWTLIVSKATGEWGIPYPGQKSDFARMDMQVSKLGKPLENFTISFDKANGACTMHLDWETTRASAEILEKK